MLHNSKGNPSLWNQSYKNIVYNFICAAILLETEQMLFKKYWVSQVNGS